MPKSEFKMPMIEDFPDVVDANRKMHDLHVQRADLQERMRSAALRAESMRLNVDAAAERLLAGGAVPDAVDYARERETHARLRGELHVVERAIAMQERVIDSAVREASKTACDRVRGRYDRIAGEVVASVRMLVLAHAKLRAIHRGLEDSGFKTGHLPNALAPWIGEELDNQESVTGHYWRELSELGYAK